MLAEMTAVPSESQQKITAELTGKIEGIFALFNLSWQKVVLICYCRSNVNILKIIVEPELNCLKRLCPSVQVPE